MIGTFSFTPPSRFAPVVCFAPLSPKLNRMRAFVSGQKPWQHVQTVHLIAQSPSQRRRISKQRRFSQLYFFRVSIYSKVSGRETSAARASPSLNRAVSIPKDAQLEAETIFSAVFFFPSVCIFFKVSQRHIDESSSVEASDESCPLSSRAPERAGPFLRFLSR